MREDISGGSERVRIALVNDSGEEAALPVFTYCRDYRFSPAAVVYMSELFSRRLVQWSGSKATRPAPGKTLPDFTSEHSVLYNQHSGMLERIQFTPCMEDRLGGQRQLLECAPSADFWAAWPAAKHFSDASAADVQCGIEGHLSSSTSVLHR